MIELTIIDNTGKRWCREVPNNSTYDIRGDEVSIDLKVIRVRKSKESQEVAPRAESAAPQVAG